MSLGMQEEGTREHAGARVREGIGICLSGGGFRAAILHLGALRRLNELGILPKVSTLSSVSGGSILSGFLADRMLARPEPEAPLGFDDWEAEVARPFRRFVARDLRTWPVLLHCAWNWLWPGPRARQLVCRYRHRLTRRMLCEVPQRPAFIFCATNMQLGVNFEFRRDRVGDWRTGYAKTPPDMPLAFAVAASACFPPLFGPMRVRIRPGEFKCGKYQEPDRERILSGLSVTDGGVYDNMGLEPVWKSHAAVLVSDAGAPMQFYVARTPLRRMLRYTSLVMNQVGLLRRRWLMSRIDERYESFRIYSPEESPEPDPEQEACPESAAANQCRLLGRREVARLRGAYWALWSDVDGYARTEDGRQVKPTGYTEPFVKEHLTWIRTDLDRFVAGETAALENHGYLLADAAVRRYLPDLIQNDIPLQVPHEDWLDEQRVLRALQKAHSDSQFYFWKRWFMRALK